MPAFWCHCTRFALLTSHKNTAAFLGSIFVLCTTIFAKENHSGLRSDERWRKAARSVLGSLEGLNRSQQRAIATAMSSTFTLWQVCAC